MKREIMKFNLKPILLIAVALLTGCAAGTYTSEPIGQSPTQPGSLYILVDRNSRLPAEFLPVFKQQTRKRLPDANIHLDDGGVDDRTLEQAEWIIVLRATRIMPNHTFKPSGYSTLNGITDCLAGSGVGPGVIMFPCEYSTDNDFLEASIRNAEGKTLKTYVAEQDGEGWMWPLPFTAIELWLTGKDQQQVWIDLTNSLFDKMLADDVFTSEPSLAAKPQ